MDIASGKAPLVTELDSCLTAYTTHNSLTLSTGNIDIEAPSKKLDSIKKRRWIKYK